MEWKEDHIRVFQTTNWNLKPKKKKDFTPPTREQRCEKMNLEANLLKVNIK